MADKASSENKYLTYKGRPLVREKDTLCYGNMDDEYILFMQIMTYRDVNGVSIPDKVLLQILKTDPTLSAAERIVKQDIKAGLYEALDIGIIWLERLLAK